MKNPPSLTPVTTASTVWLIPTSGDSSLLPWIALIKVALSPQRPSSTIGSSGGTTTLPPPSVVNVAIGNGVVAPALLSSPSRASTPLNVQLVGSKLPAFADSPLTRYAQPSKYSQAVPFPSTLISPKVSTTLPSLNNSTASSPLIPIALLVKSGAFPKNVVKPSSSDAT